jgi:glycosyltransferase involved in cell wall biosynthesis
LFAPGDADALALAIAEALALDSRAREALAAEAIAHVRTNFSKEKMCAETLALYRELLQERAAATG